LEGKFRITGDGRDYLKLAIAKFFKKGGLSFWILSR
jgi:hypothetical protein